MKISLKGMSNRELAKLFDCAAKARLAYRHHESFDAQLRYLGKRAVKRKNYPSFNMVAKLWKERD